MSRTWRPVLHDQVGGLPLPNWRRIRRSGLALSSRGGRACPTSLRWWRRDSTAGVDALVGGLHDRAVLVERPVLECGIAVDLAVTSAERVLGAASSDLHGRAVALSDLLGPPGARMVERVREATTWSQRFDAVDAELRRLLRSPGRHDTLVDVACRLLIAGRQVSATAAALGWSRQHLTRRVRAATGVTPRQLLQLGRFERSTRLLRAEGSDASLAVVAHRAGFADQSHLVRDWRRLANCTPGAWRTEQNG